MRTEADPFQRWSLTPVINVSGTMTSIGSCKVRKEVVAVVRQVLDKFLSMDELQVRASRVIAEMTGARAGCVTGCSAAAMTQAVAGAMTGSDLAAIERLPDTGHRENRVLLQSGHMINYGAPVAQAVALAGARVVPIGTSAQCEIWHLREALANGCAAALYVVSHHTVREGELPMDMFIALCKEHDVPVIVDMASEYDLTGPVAAGADLVIYSGHKFLAGITSGIVAGDLDLVRATYLQHRGIGRTMKAGKEAVAGAMVALEHWSCRDAVAVREYEERLVAKWKRQLSPVAGLNCRYHADWTGNPITRLRVAVDAEAAGLFAWELAERLSSRNPRIIVRDDLVEHGEFYLDPCNATVAEAKAAGEAIIEEVEMALSNGDGLAVTWSDVKRRREDSIRSWPGAHSLTDEN